LQMLIVKGVNSSRLKQARHDVTTRDITEAAAAAAAAKIH